MTRSEIAAANKILRAKDESHLWPIRGRFNATERAIRRCRRLFAAYYPEFCMQEYISLLEIEVSRLVNKSI